MCFRTKTSSKDEVTASAILVGGSALVMAVMIFFALKINFIGITADELGYLSNAAKFAGWQWQEAFQNYPFYGVGVSIFWMPFFLVFNEFAIIYKAVICFNGVLLVLSLWISYRCAKQLFPNVKKPFLAFVCICVSFYPSNIFYAQDALSETLLYLMFWIIFYLIIQIIKDNHWKWYVLLSFVESYMITVHWRTIVILIGTLLFLSLYNIRQIRNWKKVLLYLIIIAGGIVVAKYIQHQYIFGSVGASALNSVNTNTDILEEIKKILADIPSFAKGLFGEIFAFLVSGNICFFAGAIFCVKTCVEVLLKREKPSNERIGYSLFLVVVFGCNLVAFATNMSTLSRMDKIVYLRYMENMIGPILLIGMIVLGMQYFKVSDKSKMIFAFFILTGAQVALRGMKASQTTIFGTSSSVCIGSFFQFYNNVDIDFTILKIVTVVLAFFFWLFSMLSFEKIKKKQIYMLTTVGVLMCLYWGYVGYGAIAEQLIMKEDSYKAYHPIEELVEDEEITDVLFWQQNIENDDLKNVKYLQVLLGKMYINVISEDGKSRINRIERNENKNVLLLTAPGDTISLYGNEIEQEGYIKVFSNEKFDGYIQAKNSTKIKY